MSPSRREHCSGIIVSMATTPDQADIQVGTMGGIPVVRYGPNSHFKSGKSMAQQTLLAFRTLIDDDNGDVRVVHPEAILED